jgi:endonuclease/exonuclease/phosphatase family metal-dependent hydrolase
MGAESSAEGDALPLKLITWNIQFGHDHGLLQNGWKDRKAALAHVLERERPDVLCVQEALPGQLAFLDRVLSGHDRVGNGRDGGQIGEHCAIYFDRTRLQVEETQTFWLSDRPDTHGSTWDGHLQRIVTWAKLSDRRHGKPFRVFNTHFPLTPSGRRKSAQLLVDRMAEVREPVVLAGDFNCGPKSSVWRSFHDLGLSNAEAAAGREPGTATFRLWKFGIACLDGVFACKNWQVREHQVLKDPVRSVYPSDHYGVAVKLAHAGL